MSVTEAIQKYEITNNKSTIYTQVFYFLLGLKKLDDKIPNTQNKGFSCDLVGSGYQESMMYDETLVL